VLVLHSRYSAYWQRIPTKSWDERYKIERKDMEGSRGNRGGKVDIREKKRRRDGMVWKGSESGKQERR